MIALAALLALAPIGAPVIGFLPVAQLQRRSGRASRKRRRGSSASVGAVSRLAMGGSYFRNCSAARAAGAAPIRAGDVGYSRKLDRDGDGVACE